MSFILDALKKSESDRQEKNTPDISDVPTATTPPRSGLGAWYLVGFLSIIVVALIAVLLRPAKGPVPIVTQEIALPERETATTSTAQEWEASTANNDSVSTEPSPAREDTRPAPAPRQEPEPSEPADETAQPEPASEPPTPSPTPTVTAESYLTFNDVRASGNIELPDLHIDLHVFSEEPGDRFVFINMNQYRENAVLTEGPRLREITSEGVLLEYVGTTFLLPRE